MEFESCPFIHDSVGMNSDSTDILHELAAFLRSLEKPWVVAGDWNLEPKDLVDSNWLAVARGRLIAPKSAT